MNANELADELENTYPFVGVMEVAATMLRQQQAEIETLKSHPVKELTDEEIWELHQEHIDEVTCGHSMKTVGFIEFARAILRKAQEK